MSLSEHLESYVEASGSLLGSPKRLPEYPSIDKSAQHADEACIKNPCPVEVLGGSWEGINQYSESSGKRRRVELWWDLLEYA